MTRHNVPPVEKLERNFPGPIENVAEVGVTALRSTMPTNGKRANAYHPLLRSQPFEITSLLAGVSFFTIYPHDRMQNTAKGVVGGEEDACRVSTLCASGLYSDGFDVGEGECEVLLTELSHAGLSSAKDIRARRESVRA